MTFEILTHADQPLAGTNEDAHALGCLTADVSLSEPTRARYTFTRSDLGSYIGRKEASALTRVPAMSIS